MQSRKRKQQKPKAQIVAVTRAMAEDPGDSAIPPKEAIRHQFGRRLRQIMVEKGVRQIDIATATGIGRDSISGYARGRVIPDHDRLDQICEFLGTTKEKLVPHYGVDSRDVDLMPAFEVKQADKDGHLWLRINQAVTFQAFAEIVEVLRKHGGQVSN